MATVSSTVGLLTLGFIRSNILTKKNDTPPTDILYEIATFIVDTANYLLMIMGSNQKLYHNVSLLNTKTSISYQTNIKPTFKYNEIVSHRSYCKFQMPKQQIPNWMASLGKVYSEQVMGVFSIGGYNRTHKIEQTECNLFTLDGLNTINNKYNTMYHIKLPSFETSEKQYSFDIYSSIFHDNKLMLFNEINIVKILNIYDLKWKDYAIHWEQSRSDMGLCSLSSSKMMLLGGQNDSVFTGNVDLFDMSDDNYKISGLKAMNYSRLNCGSVFDKVSNNRVIVVGGYGGASFEKDPLNSSKSMEIYDFEKNEWYLNKKLTQYEHENCCAFLDKNNPNILMIAGNHSDPNWYGRENDGYIEYTDLREASVKWNLFSDRSLVQMFNIDDNCINTVNWRCNAIVSF